ncbi:MAG: hypothetical protein E7444_08130 [Ruminococcaceae bacterium]|nr:hypothetical protein [Oscillospiraceae bacterium]
MKKNVMMRAASVLLIMVLLTSSVISGTFAKYVTSASGTDSARVAEFGVRIDAQGEMFTDTYKGVEAGWTSANTVDGQGEDVVAPGTEGNMVSMKLTGSPEVAVRVNYEATNFSLKNWTLYDGTEYCPVVFTINTVTYGTEDTDATNKYATVAELETAIKNAIMNYSKEYAPNTNLSGVGADSLAISWSWEFSVNSTKDAKDTILGDKAAGIAEDGSAMAKAPATIEIRVKTTVTQID